MGDFDWGVYSNACERQDQHKTLNDQGEGCCGEPMWHNAFPNGFCGKPAYGKREIPGTYPDSGLMCPEHGGPEFRTFMEGDKWCAVMPDFEDLQVSPAGFGDTREEAITELKKDKSIAMPVLTKAIDDAVRFRWWAESFLQLFKIKPAIYARIDLGDHLKFERQGDESDLEIIRRIADHFMAAERSEQEAAEKRR